MNVGGSGNRRRARLDAIRQRRADRLAGIRQRQGQSLDAIGQRKSDRIGEIEHRRDYRRALIQQRRADRINGIRQRRGQKPPLGQAMLSIPQLGGPGTSGEPGTPFLPGLDVFPDTQGFRLGVFKVREETDDYLICRGFDPNARSPFAKIAPTAPITVQIAKPSLLLRTPWDGVEVEIGGINYTYQYSDDEIGVRTAFWTDEDDVDHEEEERIETPYFVDDLIVAVEVRMNSFLDGMKVFGTKVKNENGALISWVDLNVSGRHWEPSNTGTIIRRATTTTDHDSSTTADVQLYSVNADRSVVADGDPVPAYNAIHEKIKSGDWIYVAELEGGWEIISREAHPDLWGTLDSELAAAIGSTVIMSVDEWNGSAWADSGDSITLYQRFALSSAVASGSKVKAVWEPSRGVYVLDRVAC